MQSRILPALLPAECPERLRWNIHGPRRDKLKVRSNCPFVELRILPPVENRPGVERGIERPYGRHMKIARCRPGGKKFNVTGLAGHGSTGPGLMVSQTGGAASSAQLAFALSMSAGVVLPRLVVLLGQAIPSFPVWRRKRRSRRYRPEQPTPNLRRSNSPRPSPGRPTGLVYRAR